MFLTGTYEDEDMKKGPLFSRKFSFSNKILLGSVSGKTWQFFFSLTEKNLSNFPLYGSLKSMKKLFLFFIIPYHKDKIAWSNSPPLSPKGWTFSKIYEGRW